MGRVNFTDAVDNSSSGVEFFKLDNNKVARVQFFISTPNDIPTFYAHNVSVKGYQFGKDVQCNRDDYADSDCELCKAGLPRKTVSILVMYDLNDKKVKVWQRGKKFVEKNIIPLLNRYDLSKTVVEIERHGEGTDTSYTMFPMPNDEPVDLSNIEVPSDFNFVLWKKSNDDMLTFLHTGTFPQNNENTASHNDEPVTRRRSTEEEPTVRTRSSRWG